MRKFIILFISVFVSIVCVGKTYRVSLHGENIIKNHEHLELTSYWDSNGYSIGWGHHASNIRKNQHISRVQAEIYFRRDMIETNKSVNKLLDSLPIKHNFPQNFIDGLGDLVFNCGEGGVRNSEFYKKLKLCRKNNKKDMDYCVSFIKTMKISSPGHVQRRYETHKQMLT